VVTNLFGTPNRIELAFGKRPLELIKQVVEFAETFLPPSLPKLWKNKNLAREALKLGTRSVRQAPVLEICQSPVDLNALPILTTWPLDGGPFITLPLVYTEHPVTNDIISVCIAFSHDATSTGMYWQLEGVFITRPLRNLINPYR
jgi:UbiD family decarboxylase